MRLTILSAVAALLLPACLGGGSSGATAVQTAAMEGTVYEVDGQTVNRAGVTVRVLETGATATTGVDGAFTFNGLEPGSYTLDFDSTVNANLRAIAHQEGDGEGQGGETDGEKETDGEREEPRDGDRDEEGEDHEGRPRIDVTRECGRIVIRVALDNGRVKEFVVERHDVRHAKARLHMTETSSVDVEGAVRIRSGEAGEAIKICVGGLDAGTVIEVFLDDREGGGPVSMGTVAANAEGVACVERNTREGGELLLGAAALGGREGDRIEVRLGGRR